MADLHGRLDQQQFPHMSNMAARYVMIGWRCKTKKETSSTYGCCWTIWFSLWNWHTTGQGQA